MGRDAAIRVPHWAEIIRQQWPCAQSSARGCPGECGLGVNAAAVPTGPTGETVSQLFLWLHSRLFLKGKAVTNVGQWGAMEVSEKGRGRSDMGVRNISL